MQMDEKQFINILLSKIVDVAEAKGRIIECNLTLVRQNEKLRNTIKESGDGSQS